MNRLQIAPGGGLLVRLRRAALFLPAAAGAADLVTAFAGSADGAALDAVTTLADERELDVPPFVVAEWADVLRLAVYGPVEVTSDHRSLARLSGAGSATWVERTVRAGHIRIEVTADGLHTASDLQLGTVAAGGFALTLEVDGPPGAAPPDHRTTAPPSAPPRHTATRAPVVSAEPAPSFDIGAFDARAGRDDPTIDVPTGFTDGYRAVSEPDTDPDSEPNTEPDTDAVIGSRAATGKRSAPDKRSRPERWTLRFLDGPAEHVDRTLVVGRRPTEGDAGPKPVRLVQLDCPQMSARHLTVWADAVGLWVTDLNSRNRSWVVTSGDHRLVALEPNVATRLEHGTHVQIGTKVFVVERG